MSFLNRLLGKSDPLAAIDRALREKRWADALAAGEKLSSGALEPEEEARFEDLLVQAGDGLARLNLDEGEGCLRGGDKERAKEHFLLAVDQARSDRLRDEAARALAACAASDPAAAAPAPEAAQSCSSGSCASAGRVAVDEQVEEAEPESEDLFELLLVGLPAAEADRYRQRSDAFRRAVLSAHREEKAALESFDALPEEERDDIFYFERGSLLGRLGRVGEACRDMEEALTLNPQSLVATETLINLQLAGGEAQKARSRLEKLLDQGVAAPFCHAHLALIHAGSGDLDRALVHGQEAIAGGQTAPDLLVLTSSLLEKEGRLDEAEALLMRLSGGGCGGGANVHLAEFWLRRGKSLNRALEGFKSAMRQDRENPRWPLRIAQTYLALGWVRDGIDLLRKTLSHPELDPNLRREGEASLKGVGKG